MRRTEQRREDAAEVEVAVTQHDEEERDEVEKEESIHHTLRRPGPAGQPELAGALRGIVDLLAAARPADGRGERIDVVYVERVQKEAAACQAEHHGSRVEVTRQRRGRLRSRGGVAPAVEVRRRPDRCRRRQLRRVLDRRRREPLALLDQHHGHQHERHRYRYRSCFALRGTAPPEPPSGQRHRCPRQPELVDRRAHR